jgi:hypothetical protein
MHEPRFGAVTSIVLRKASCRARSWQTFPIDVHSLARSDMIHRDIGSHGSMTGADPDPLKDALDLQIRVRSLRALLELQRWQIEVLNDRLYSSDAGGIAAKRLLALKRSETETLQAPRAVNDP